jgi:hypothetical protein
MTKPIPQSTLLQTAATAMLHALDPVQWAADRLNWHSDGWQAELLRCPDRQIAVCCSRQSGKSTTTATLAAHTAIFQPGSLTLLLSPSQRQASELLTKVRSVLTHPGLNTKLEQNAATSLELLNGSRVVSLPSSPDAIRGYSKPALIIEDEAAWITAEVHHLSLRPMMATSTNGRFILLSTPAGRSGHFYEACHSPNWRRFKVTAYECPRISQEFLDQELRENGDLYFSREFLCDFSDSEFSFFGSDLIAAAFNCEIPALTLDLFT